MEPTLEQRLRMYRNITRRTQIEYFVWGFIGGLLAGVGGALLVTGKG